MINISNLKEAIDMASRLNPLFRQLAMSIVDSPETNTVKIDTHSDLCRIVISCLDGIAKLKLELASSSEVKTFIDMNDSAVLTSLGDIAVDGNCISVTKRNDRLLAAAGWLIGCAVRFRQMVDKLSERLSPIGDIRRKYLISICPKENESVELLIAKDKLPESYQEGQHIIGRHRFSMSGEGFRAECRLLYFIGDKPLIKVYEGPDLIFCDNADLKTTDDLDLSLEKEIKISPLPATVVVERRMAFEVEFRYELLLEPEEKFEISKLHLFGNESTEFDPDCYDGLSLEKIKYGSKNLSLANRNSYGTWRARYFFGTLYPSYIEYINV